MRQQSVESRLAALNAEVERRKMIQEEPLDPLSQSLKEYYQELASLDELGKVALLEELNREDPLVGKQSLGLNPADIDKMVEDAQENVTMTFRAKLI